MLSSRKLESHSKTNLQKYLNPQHLIALFENLLRFLHQNNQSILHHLIVLKENQAICIISRLKIQESKSWNKLGFKIRINKSFKSEIMNNLRRQLMNGDWPKRGINKKCLEKSKERRMGVTLGQERTKLPEILLKTG